MGKKKGARSEAAQANKVVSGLPFLASNAELDPAVASLFASSVSSPEISDLHSDLTVRAVY